MKSFEIVPSLTAEEIQTIQVDEALRILGLIDTALVELNHEMIDKTRKYFEARKELEELKSIKTILVERARILKTIVSNA